MGFWDSPYPGQPVDPGLPPGYDPTQADSLARVLLAQAGERDARSTEVNEDRPPRLTFPGLDTSPNLPDYHQLMAPDGWPFPIYNGPLNIRYRSVG